MRSKKLLWLIVTVVIILLLFSDTRPTLVPSPTVISPVPTGNFANIQQDVLISSPLDTGFGMDQSFGANQGIGNTAGIGANQRFDTGAFGDTNGATGTAGGGFGGGGVGGGGFGGAGVSPLAPLTSTFLTPEQLQLLEEARRAEEEARRNQLVDQCTVNCERRRQECIRTRACGVSAISTCYPDCLQNPQRY
jgi:hypothetical protein